MQLLALLLASMTLLAAERPNFIIVLTDDQGWGDLGCYGSPYIRTPRIDRMAAEGIRFTDFYAQPFCGPSRAALLTGSYPPRNSLMFNHLPRAKTGIHPDEVTLPELLKGVGYTTAMFGKWHLGDAPEFLPVRHGFDEYLGLPYSNDMWPYHPKVQRTPDDPPVKREIRARAEYTGYQGQGQVYPLDWFPDLPLIRNNDVVELNPDQSRLSGMYIDEAIRFIRKNRAHPFLVYVAHAMPHVPLFRSEPFEGVSERGLYGDVIAELDAGVGRLLDELRSLDIDENTLVLFLSDNGPWHHYGIDSGSAGPLRGAKGSVWEGGVRVPAVWWWPGKIPGARVTSEIAANIDVFPTLGRLAGATMPDDRVLDGVDLWPLLSGESDTGPRRDFFYYEGIVFYHATDGAPVNKPVLRAVRDEEWKLWLAGEDGQPPLSCTTCRRTSEKHPTWLANTLTSWTVCAPKPTSLTQNYVAPSDPWAASPVSDAAAAYNGSAMAETNRRQFLKTSAAGGAAALLGCGTEETQQVAERPPNIVYIMADDLGYGELGCYGQDRIQTPVIDQMAAEGMSFSDAYAGCCVCAPCRSVLMTGMHMGHTSVRSNPGGVPLLPDDVTVAELLKPAGYATGCFGKWGLGDIGTEGVPWKQGFDEFVGYLHQAHAHYFYPHYIYDNDRQLPLPGNEGDGRGTYSHDVIADRSLDFIRRNKDNPFLCYVPFTIPHAEYVVPDDSMSQYSGKFEEPEPWFNKNRPDRLIRQEEPHAALAGMITRMDRDVGRILDLLKELELDDNTIVFFTSDNGAAAINWTDYFQSSGNLRAGKGTFYEGGIRVPMIARWPGKIAPGSHSDLPWAFWDILPTFTDLAGVETAHQTDGLSVAPTLLGEGEQQRHDYLYWELPRSAPGGTFRDEVPRQGVRMGNWKAVRPAPDGPLELYDLASDESETTDVASANPDVMQQIEEYLRTARVEPRVQTQPDHIWWEKKG